MNNMKLRFFAVGILFVTVVLFIYVQFFNKAEQEDVKKTLKKDGYALVTMDEFEELKNKVDMLEKGQLNEEQQNFAKNVSFFIGDDVVLGITTAINDVALPEDVAGQAIYDLQGRRVLNPSNGIYIVNGKKFVVK